MKFGERLPVLLLGVLVLAGVAAGRSFEYDEAYSVFVTSPAPRPEWPHGIFRVGEVRPLFHALAGPAAIAAALRQTDVHPPLYFWILAAWRAVAGDGLIAIRLLSALCATAALALVGQIASRARIPVRLAMLLTLGCYGFAYTGSIARGFALAQALTLAGVLATMIARRAPLGALAGLLFGAAVLTNYLSSFVAAAALSWLALARFREWRVWGAAWAAFGSLLPVALWFFLAQRDSRAGQFPPFRLLPAVMRLAEYAAANVAGGLPLYVAGWPSTAMRVAIALLLLGLGALVAARWGRIGGPGPRRLLLACAGAPGMGLLLLGAVFDTTPVELRYLAFATPYAALLAAGALHRIEAAGILALQTAAVAGLAMHPATMQPARAVAREVARAERSGAILLLPRGNDGVGAVAPTIAELPDSARVMLIDGPTEALPAGAVLLAPVVAQDERSRASLRALAGQGCQRPAGDEGWVSVVGASCAGSTEGSGHTP